MNQQLIAEDPRYSLKTLQAMYYGAVYGGVTDRGILHITFIDHIAEVHSGSVLDIGPNGVHAYTEDGEVVDRVPPSRIIHAEVF